MIPVILKYSRTDTSEEISVKVTFKNSIVWKTILVAASVAVMALIAGCTSGFAEPYDISNIYFNYTTVSGSDGEYIVITKHIASQSDVRIPDTIYGLPVREIADSVFAEDELIESVTFGKNMRVVGSNAFGGCPRLQSVTFNVSMTDIGDYAFKECASLPSVALPENLQTLGRGAFYNCGSLSDITVPHGIQKVGGRAFGGTKWLKAKSKKKFVTVGDGILIAYNGDKADVTLPKSIRQIAGAFAGNTVVKTVDLNNGLTSVGDMAFMGCTSLMAVRIPASLSDIGSNAFYGCSAMSQITLIENIHSIGPDAFTDCSAKLLVRKGSYAERYCAENGLDCFTLK